MLKKMLLAGVVGGSLMVAGAQAQEMHGGMHHGGPGGDGYLGFLQGVTLTSAQQTQMHTIMHTNWQQLKPQMQQLHSLRHQINDALASTSTVNAGQLTSLQQQVATLQAQLDQSRLGTALQVRAMLTPNQLGQSSTVHAQLAALHQQERNVMSQASGAASPEKVPAPQ